MMMMTMMMMMMMMPCGVEKERGMAEQLQSQVLGLMQL
jgi:hypothetical protein